MRLVIVLATLMLPMIAMAQMQHAVIYQPVAAVKDLGKDGECNIRHKWLVSKTADAEIYYAYIDPMEAECLNQSGQVKFWVGGSAKEAWKNAYAAGLPESRTAVEKSVRVPIQVFDAEAERDVVKYLPLDEAKQLNDKAAVTIDLFSQPGDAMLPRKVFDGSK